MLVLQHFRGRRVRSLCKACLFVVTAAGGTVQVAGASTATPNLMLSPSSDFHDGEPISISVGPNGLFTPHAHINILECADPGGTTANLPKSDSTCDGNTIQANTILIASDGSFSDTKYVLYTLPSSTLGEESNGQPVCNNANPCVLYVGQDQNDFTAPKLISAPFAIGAATASTATSVPTTTSTSPASPQSSASAPSVVPTTSSAAVSLSTDASSDSGVLAATGVPLGTVWTVTVGACLFLVGCIGRRFTTRKFPFAIGGRR
jgi:hypothetical protein